MMKRIVLIVLFGMQSALGVPGTPSTRYSPPVAALREMLIVNQKLATNINSVLVYYRRSLSQTVSEQFQRLEQMFAMRPDTLLIQVIVEANFVEALRFIRTQFIDRFNLTSDELNVFMNPQVVYNPIDEAVRLNQLELVQELLHAGVPQQRIDTLSVNTIEMRALLAQYQQHSAILYNLHRDRAQHITDRLIRRQPAPQRPIAVGVGVYSGFQV